MHKFLLLMIVAWGHLAGAQTQVSNNPVAETFYGKVKEVASASYTASGDSLKVAKDRLKDEERLLHKRVYTTKGRLAEINYLRPDNNLKYRTVFTRDKKGNVTLETNYMSGGVKTKSIERTYDKKGLMLTQITKNEKDKIIERNIFAYQDTIRVFEQYMSGDSVCSRMLKSVRDKNGRLLEQTWYDDDCKTIMTKVKVEYDAKKNMSVCKTFTPNDRLISRRNFAYDASNRLIAYTDTDHKEVVFKQMDYTYNDKGKLAKEVMKGKNGEFISETNYVYDSLGRVVKDHRIHAQRETNVTLYFTFDQKGNLVKRKQVIPGLETQVETWKYEYDEQGNWIKRTHFRQRQAMQVDERKITYY